MHVYGETSHTPPTHAHLGTSIGIADYEKLEALLREALGRTTPIVYGEYGVNTTIPPRERTRTRAARSRRSIPSTLDAGAVLRTGDRARRVPAARRDAPLLPRHGRAPARALPDRHVLRGREGEAGARGGRAAAAAAPRRDTAPSSTARCSTLPPAPEPENVPDCRLERQLTAFLAIPLRRRHETGLAARADDAMPSGTGSARAPFSSSAMASGSVRDCAVTDGRPRVAPSPRPLRICRRCPRAPRRRPGDRGRRGVAIVAVIDLVSASQHATSRGVGTCSSTSSRRHHARVPTPSRCPSRSRCSSRRTTSSSRRSRALQLALVLLVDARRVQHREGAGRRGGTVTAGARRAALERAASRSTFVTSRRRCARLCGGSPLLCGGVCLASLAAVAFAAPADASTNRSSAARATCSLWHRRRSLSATSSPDAARRRADGPARAAHLGVPGLPAARRAARPARARSRAARPPTSSAAHGADTLSFFKLRGDNQYLFNAGADAPSSATGSRTACSWSRATRSATGGRSAACCASPPLRRGARAAARRARRQPAARELFEQAGLRALYLGDEAIVDTARFSLEGRPIRKVRQSVTRLQKAGYRASSRARLARRGTLAGSSRSPHWLGRARARFRDGDGLAAQAASGRSSSLATTRPARPGFLHFVPSYGRAAVSLSFMRRDHDTPNGLTEFLVVRGDRAAARARHRGGVAQLRRVRTLLREPAAAPSARSAGVALGDTWFQIESLYRFNAKFSPRWEPRYLSTRAPGLPRPASRPCGPRASCRSRGSAGRQSAAAGGGGGRKAPSTASTARSQWSASQTQKSASGTSTSASIPASTCS